MFRSLSMYFNYRLWFAGWLVSNIGAWMQRTAQDWVILTELTDHNASALGIAGALQFAPQIALAGVAGVLADRFDRRKVIFATQLALAVLGAILAVLMLTGVLELWMVFALSLATGLVTAIDLPARQSFVSELVRAPELPNAVGLNSSALNSARLIGPALAGLLIVPIGAGWVFVINVITFVAMLAAVLLLRKDELTPIPRSSDRRGHFRAGLRYIRSQPQIVVIIVAMFVFGCLGGSTQIVVAALATTEFAAGAELFGILLSAIAIGSIAGALIAARRRTARLRYSIIAAFGFFVSAAVAVFIPSVWVFGALLAFIGLFTQQMIQSSNTYVQLATPIEYRGRVIAVFMAIFLGSNMIGAPLIGFIIDHFGARWGLAVNALSGLLIVLLIVGWALASRRVRLIWSRERRWPLRFQPGDAIDTPDEVEQAASLTAMETRRN